MVLAAGLHPPVAAPALNEMFGLAPGPDGFMAGGEGVLVAGSAGGPRSILESMATAALAAAQAAVGLLAAATPPRGEVAHA